MLPRRSLVRAFEKSASGFKKAKDRVTTSACSNASGTVKLSLLLIGKSKKPRCFSRVNLELLPFLYWGQKNAWMDSGLFWHWFQTCFVVVKAREQLEAINVGREVFCCLIIVLQNITNSRRLVLFLRSVAIRAIVEWLLDRQQRFTFFFVYLAQLQRSKRYDGRVLQPLARQYIVLF